MEGMQGKQSKAIQEKFIIAGAAHKILPDSLNAHLVLGQCPDFTFERTALQSVVEKRGHILLPSVVCTPGTAGGGIEYAWGKLKFEQRRQNDLAVKLESGVKFVERVRVLCKGKDILPLSRIWKFGRRARDYTRLYLVIGQRHGRTTLSHADIEKMRSKQKTHRNIMEMDRDFVRRE